MKTRIRYAFRTLAGPWLVIPAAGLEIANFFQRGMPWRGEGMWTVEWFAISLFILGPLCAGVAAVDAARLTRPGNIHLILAVPRPGLAYVRAAMWSAIPLIGIHLIVISAGVLVGQVRQPSVGWWAMLAAALIQCCAILWFASLGSAVGRFASPLLAGLVAGIGGLVLTYVVGDALSGDGFQLLALGAATVTLIGRAYNPHYLIGQAAVLLLTSTLFLLLGLRARSGYRIPTRSGAVLALAAVVAIAGAPAVLPANRKIDDHTLPTLCRGTKPKVCLYYEHRRYASLILPKIESLSKAALDKGYNAFVPRKIIEESRSQHPGGPGVRSLWLPAEVYEQGEFPLEQLAYFLLVPSHCDWLTSPTPPPAELDTALFSLLATWLRLAGHDIEHAPVPYRILTPEEVGGYLDAFGRCEMSGIR